MLEILVRLGIGTPPEPFQLLRIEAPDDTSIRDYPAREAPALDRSRAWGDRWLAAGETALARVPSAIAPHTHNLLINPAHPDAAAIRVAAKSHHPWDKRLFR